MPHPVNRWAWIVDFQNDFVLPTGALPVPGADQLIAPMNQYLKSLSHDRYSRIIYSFDSHYMETYVNSLEHRGVPEQNIPGFPPHCIVDTDGWKLACDYTLAPRGAMKLEIRKNEFDVWADHNARLRTFTKHQTPIVFDNDWNMNDPTWIRENRGNTVEVVGVASDFCVRHAIAGFLKNGFNVEVVENLTAGIMRDMPRVCADEWANHPLLKIVKWNGERIVA